MKQKSILVFGAAGFIGTYLFKELLNQNHHVVASDISGLGSDYYARQNIPFEHVDITKKEDFQKLEKYKFDVVIHLAACQPANVSEERYDPCEYIQVNVLGTLNILEFCRTNQVQEIIYCSSHRNTQGLWKENKLIDEDMGRSIKYDGQYAMFSISESAAQDCVLHYEAQYGIKAILFRIPPVYGYGPHTEIFLNGKAIKTGFQIFIDKSEVCEPLEIWGNPTAGRDIIYVKDLISAFINVLEKEEARGLYNISSGRLLTLQEQAETTARLFWGNDKSPVITYKPEKENGIESFCYNIEKAKNDLNWIPQFSFEDMLLDYKKEMKNKDFEYLLKKRNIMLNKTEWSKDI